ncbi:MAG: DNRLRE domain-containing protein [Firmicutes bacterium]|nr:DNRLRE domain-containing protein [Bacillota bacterium]
MQRKSKKRVTAIIVSAIMVCIAMIGTVSGLRALAEPAKIYPTDDMYIHNHQGKSINSAYMRVQFRKDELSANSYAYMKFTVPDFPAGTGVTLKMYKSNENGKGPWKVYPISDNSWSESVEYTWDTKPEFDAFNPDVEPIGATGAIDATAAHWVEVDLSSYITKAGTYSIVIINTVNSNAQIASKEDKDKNKHPYLEIDGIADPMPAKPEPAATPAPTVTPAAAPASAPDAASGFDPAQALNSLGVLIGSDDGLTEEYLNSTPTRIQAAVLYLRLKGLEKEAKSFSDTDNFSDGINHWGAKYMAYLKANPELGMVGVGGNLFEPDTLINAKEYYKVMLESLGYAYDTDYTWDNLENFAAEHGLKDAYLRPDFDIKALAAATVEALIAKEKGSENTLLDELISKGAIDKAKADEIKGLVPVVFHVKDFGAIADDGQCDVSAIRDAITAASKEENAVVLFDGGVYNLKDAAGKTYMVGLVDVANIRLVGQVAASGSPATTLQMNIPLTNDFEGLRHIDIFNSQNIKVENLTLDHYPRPQTAGKVISVDTATDTVVVEILPGLPHFDGMKNYSANAWDLTTKRLTHVPALSIGTSGEKFSNLWQAVPGSENQYKISGMGFSKNVEIGQGISWHFNVLSSNGHNMRIHGCKNVSALNIDVLSSFHVPVNLRATSDVTFKKFHITPEGNSLATAPRDGFHMLLNSGYLFMDDVYIKGVRWDPINSKSKFVEITAVKNANTIEYTSNLTPHAKAGQGIVIWAGEAPLERQITDIKSLGDNKFEVTLDEVIPDYVVVGDWVTPKIWLWEKAVIRNSTFTGNCGTGIIYQNWNLLLENNVFDNNTYADIAMGPINTVEGPFVKNIIIRNNVFSDSNWILKAKHKGALTISNANTDLPGSKYNTNILIENNTFKDLTEGEHVVAIDVQNAQNVEIRHNHYENVTDRISIDKATTLNVSDND